jgi:hypothetical protein
MRRRIQFHPISSDLRPEEHDYFNEWGKIHYEGNTLISLATSLIPSETNYIYLSGLYITSRVSQRVPLVMRGRR